MKVRMVYSHQEEKTSTWEWQVATNVPHKQVMWTYTPKKKDTNQIQIWKTKEYMVMSVFNPIIFTLIKL